MHSVDEDRFAAKNTVESTLSDAVSDDDIYVLNPIFRLRNEDAKVLLNGLDIGRQYQLHHSGGVTMALFDGKRTVGEIVKLVMPFARNCAGDSAFETARSVVKQLVATFRLTSEEQEGGQKSVSDVPSEAALIPSSMLPMFGAMPRIEYDPYRMLPEHSYPPNPHPDVTNKLRAPLSVTWHLTSRCPVDCCYCYLGRRDIDSSHMLPKTRVLEIIREAHEIGVQQISLGGGDIILYPHLFEVLDAIADYRFLPLRLSTKAMVDKRTAARLAEYDAIIELQFSIDSAVPKVADWLVRCPGFFSRTMKAIENALEAGLPVTAKAVITPYNIFSIPDLYRQLRRKGVSSVRLASYGRSAYHHTDDLFNHAESVEWLMGELESLRAEFPDDSIRLQNGVPMLEPVSVETRAARWPERSGCSAGRSQVMICADGKVIPCEQMPETDEYFCGDVTVQSLQEVWDIEQMNLRTVCLEREKFKGTECYECEEWEYCHMTIGNCIRDMAQHYGTIYKPASNCPKADYAFVRTL